MSWKQGPSCVDNAVGEFDVWGDMLDICFQSSVFPLHGSSAVRPSCVSEHLSSVTFSRRYNSSVNENVSRYPDISTSLEISVVHNSQETGNKVHS